jgi:putative oxidoreductase
MLRDVGLLLARSAVGLSMSAHGAQKAFGWFGGPGPKGAAEFMGSLGFTPPERYGALASYNEIVSGLLCTLGLGGPLGPGIIVAQMIVAQTTVHAKKGYFMQEGGVELGVIYVSAAILLAMSGYGRYSLDRQFQMSALEDDRLITAVLLGAAGAGIAALRERKPNAA